MSPFGTGIRSGTTSVLLCTLASSFIPLLLAPCRTKSSRQQFEAYVGLASQPPLPFPGTAQHCLAQPYPPKIPDCRLLSLNLSSNNFHDPSS
ncbi:hypothetical protein J3E68DRAFT_396853 [Trichoderma sp. SZMC 28012]